MVLHLLSVGPLYGTVQPLRTTFWAFGGSLGIPNSNPAFMLKVITSAFSSKVVTLMDFHPPLHVSAEDRSHSLSLDIIAGI